MDPHHRRKDVIKILVAMIWTIVLPIFYSSSRKKYTCYSTQEGRWLGEWCYSSYMVAVALYLITNGVNMVLFLVPAVGKYIETSNTRICTVLSWWTQVRVSFSCIYFCCIVILMVIKVWFLDRLLILHLTVARML